ncbi:PhnD/SsuA/transferrin family substrate-binding protein [Cyanobacteria bacterium FACHB-471]|nr:PhnD/SsuA/transferrin family substrate-binding protein [Cyanobacteria bacterium FACHB-471]
MSNSMPHSLQIASYLAPNLMSLYAAVGQYLERALKVKTQIWQSEFDPLEDPKLLHDQIDLAFVCGLPFARHTQVMPDQFVAIAAPVMQAERYQNRPVYFSDVIVSATSELTLLDQLAGKTFCYNDPGSNSGYNLLRDRLMQLGYPSHFFGKVIQSGSHQHSIAWVAEGKVDCAAIDSTVLEQEFRNSPERSLQLRIIESIGPCPMPPLVAAQRLGNTFLDQLQSVLLNPDAELQSYMQQVGIRRFAAVKSEDYEAIAHMYNAALEVGYEIIC